MIYSNGTQRLDDMAKAVNSSKALYRLAKVDSITDGKAVLRFYGESVPSSKEYKRLASYTPAAGDTVLLMAVSSTYVVLGKVV